MQGGLTNGAHLIDRICGQKKPENDQENAVLNPPTKAQISAESLMFCFALYFRQSVVHV